MLYEQWRKIAAERDGETAMREAATGRRWTFAELFAAGETRDIGEADIFYPQGQGAEFIFDLLAAWRRNQTVCPLETGQEWPKIPAPPKNCVHLKSTSATGGKDDTQRCK